VIPSPLQILCMVMAAAFLSFIGAPQRAEAHPHVWVTVETEILHDAHKNITGFRHHWAFDEFYSKFATEGLDKNNDGVLDRDELKELADVNVQSLQEYGFFTFPQLGKKEVERLQPQDYFLEHNKDNGMLALHFTLPLKEPVPRAKLKDFTFAVYDPTFYVAFAFEKDPIRLAEGMTDCRPEITKPEAQAPAKSLSESIYSQNNSLMNFGQQYAQTIRLKCNANP
jgi:ABC-type uncharacterized transport system substrate-binding protein